MGPMFAGAILGALVVILALAAVYFNGKYRSMLYVAQKLSTEASKLANENARLTSELQKAVAPVKVSLDDEQVFKLGHMINYAVEKIRKAETAGTN